jgi:DNA repair protein RadD
MQVTLRPYQEQSVYLLNRALNGGAHPLCVLPTGSGKSLVLAALLKERDQRALVLSHVAELLEQDAHALRRVAPYIEQSFYSAGLGEKKLGTQVVFGSVQSVYRNVDRFRAARPLIMIDEAHLCPRKSEAMYARVFAHFATSQRIGFTATAQRMDSGSLVEGADAWFDCIAHQVEIPELIDAGYLLPLTGVIAEQQADMSEVGMRGGEFIAEEAQAAVLRTLSLPAAVTQACALAKKRRSWLVFAAGIEHAQQIETEMRRQGVSAESVFGETDDDTRADRIGRFRAGTLRALINVGVLTTGFDAPIVDCIISMRPTQSPVLWQQMLGRGMRLAERKSDCLLLDFVGNLERLGGSGAVTSISDTRLPVIPNAAPVKRAPTGRRIKRAPPSFFDASHRDPMLSGDVFDASVTRTSYFLVNSRKQPGKRMLVAAYALEDQFGRALTARSFVCVEYAGGARYHAVQWFARRGVASGDVPHDALAALVAARGAPQPVEVTARFDARLRGVVIEREQFAS